MGRPTIARPVWPWWLLWTFGTPVAIVFLVIGLVAQAPTLALAGNASLVGRNAVVSAVITAESSHSVPWANATYTFTLPSTAPGALAGSTHEYTTPLHELFTTSTPYPEHADFRIVYASGGSSSGSGSSGSGSSGSGSSGSGSGSSGSSGSDISGRGFAVIGPAPAGSLHVITARTVAAERPAIVRARIADGLMVLGWVALVGGALATLCVLTGRRRRAVARARLVQQVPLPLWPQR